MTMSKGLRSRVRAAGLASAILTLSLAACGGAPTPAPSAGQPGVSGAIQLVTLGVGPGIRAQVLEAAIPDAKVLTMLEATGKAIVAIPAGSVSLSASSTSAQLGTLGVHILAVEQDTPFKVQGSSEAMSVTSWAGGITSWAGSVTSWAGGLPYMSSSTQTDLKAYWTKLNLPYAHQLVPEQGQGVKVAVLDTGVDLNHPLLKGQLYIPAYSDYVDGDSFPQDEPTLTSPSYMGHGTGVAGIILQVAPKATIMPYRVLNANGVGSTSKIVQAMSRAVKEGAKVINLSLGSTTDVTALNNAIQDAISQGVVVVNSAGNTGTEGMLYPARNISNASFPTDGGLVGVGSVNMSLYKSSFTSYGSNMSLTAPGEAIVTAYPYGGLMRASGTSFAAPAISGAVALARSAGVNDVTTLVSNLRSKVTLNLDPLYNSKLGTGTLNIGKYVDVFR